MKKLIVNADDFGMTEGVNRAIIEGHTRGAISSSTLMANMPAFDSAVRLAKIIRRSASACTSTSRRDVRSPPLLASAA